MGSTSTISPPVLSRECGRVQGVLVSIRRHGVVLVLQPFPARTKKISSTIDEALAKDDMAPDVAGRLAGDSASSPSQPSAQSGRPPAASVCQGTRRRGDLGH